MDKDSFPNKLNAEYYRRKNTAMASEGPKYGQPSPAGGSGVEPPLPPPPHAVALRPTPPPTPPPANSRARGVMRRAFVGTTNAVGRTLRIGGKVVGLVSAVSMATYYYQSNQVDDYFGLVAAAADDNDDDNKSHKSKKRVLVLPFDNLKVVERQKVDQFDLVRRTAQQNKQPTITIEAKELVKIIHHAASDPNISALYADFGEGMRYPMGYAHIEEIANAIRCFNESHRVHREPNVNHNPVFAMMRNGDPKPSYAFGYGFGWEEYFLASAFSYVHLQARGNLNLFGHASMNMFVRGALDKYGIKAHVFRHGKYKNAPSMFTDKSYSKAHLESVQSMTSSLNNSVCTSIENSRALNFDNVMWQSIFEYGSLTSTNSVEIGLVDSIPPVDPLISLLDVTKSNNIVKERNEQSKASEELLKKLPEKLQAQEAPFLSSLEERSKKAGKQLEKFEEKFGLHESFSKWQATDATSLDEYRIMLKKKNTIEGMRKQTNSILHSLSATSSATSMILDFLGLRCEGDPVVSDRVAVITVDGAIGSTESYEIIRSLRKIRKDPRVKAVVLRVNSPGGGVVSSEAILEEVKLLDKPVICSMSNFAASGGYYISMNSEKIFAQPTTITGSIGVFGIKFDASKLANSYGVSGDYYPHGSHAAALHPLAPLTPAMKDNIDRIVLDYYDWFKSIVANGRSLSVDEVEKVAQGRVWTGEQAKEVGLVDAFGGLDRAISYAKTTHTKTEEVEVDHWPKTLGLLDLFGQKPSNIFQAVLAAAVEQEGNTKSGSIEQLLSTLTELKFAEKPHFMLAMDEETALDIIMRGE